MSDNKTLAQRLEKHARQHAELAESFAPDPEQRGYAADLREAIALLAAREALAAERDALRVDTERLDWVEAQAIQIEDECRDSGRWAIEWAGGGELTRGDTIRFAIDAARGAA
jgi:hypothetical protein